MKLALLLLGIPAFGQSFYAAGVSALPQSSPKPAGWTAVAVPTNATQSIWSISGLDYSVTSAHKIQSVAWSAVATPATTKLGSFKFFVLAGAGGATTATNAGYAITGGTMGILPLGKYGALVGGWTVEKTSVGGLNNYAKLGWGMSFNK